MTQMWLLWWPNKNSSATKTGGGETTDAAVTGGSSNPTEKGGSSSSAHCCCGCLSKLARKVKKQGKVMLRAASGSRQGSFECQYDPLSYSLNFDASGCGSSVDDEDYYQFYAFSSRFAANPRRPSPNAAASLTS